MDEAKQSEMVKYGIKPVVLDPKATKLADVPIFYHWSQRFPVRYPTIKSKTFSHRLERRWLRHRIANYYADYNYWVDLFQTYNIKLYFTWYTLFENHCVIVDALESLGGVTAVYQRSFQEFPATGTTVAADVAFSFSKNNVEIEKKSHSMIPYHVVTGYMWDQRFPFMKEYARGIRVQLQQKGVKRILTFLDENSHDDPRWWTGHELMRENYIFLLEKLLATPWLGLVLKPKVPSTLERRLGPAAELLRKAKQTGRCIIVEGGVLHGSYPPAVAALASDLTIHGHLCAATAGVEAALTGVPTLLLDREGWPMSTLYRLGKGRVVFTDWPTLWKACLEHWDHPAGTPGFGDWSPLLDEFDPFRDGRAAERVGVYLHWILEGFKAGLPRETILADAAERYSQRWGKDKVNQINVTKKSP